MKSNRKPKEAPGRVISSSRRQRKQKANTAPRRCRRSAGYPRRPARRLASIALALLLAAFAGCERDDGPTPSEELCGNGAVDPGEQCDGANLNSQSCQSLGYETGVLTCTESCTFNRVGCSGGNESCGNGQLDQGEECDGQNLDGVTCQSLGYEGGGSLACRQDCTLDTNGCIPSQEECGNGVRDVGEHCDGADLGGETCVSQGYSGGALSCRPDCTFDTSQCIQEQCGNGAVEGTEECDGADLDGSTCVSLGYDGGTLACNASCTFDTSGCSGCGNGELETGEECDGSNLGGSTCQLLGYDGGSLSCTTSCQLDDSGCYEFAIISSPPVNQWTPSFSPQTNCTCSGSDTDCHSLYVGRVTGINGHIASLEFEKTTGGGPSADVHYWVAVGPTYPSCTEVDIYVSRTDGVWSASSSRLSVNVNVWPDAAAFEAAPCGETKNLFVITGGTGGHENDRIWYQRQAIELEKTCN